MFAGAPETGSLSSDEHVSSLPSFGGWTARPQYKRREHRSVGLAARATRETLQRHEDERSGAHVGSLIRAEKFFHCLQQVSDRRALVYASGKENAVFMGE